jgi:hypothetical protein
VPGQLLEWTQHLARRAAGSGRDELSLPAPHDAPTPRAPVVTGPRHAAVQGRYREAYAQFSARFCSLEEAHATDRLLARLGL